MPHGRSLTMIKTLQKRQARPGGRFYYPDRLSNGAEVHLPTETGNHAVRSLRLGVGDPVVLFDGHGGEYKASISRIQRGTVTVKTESFVDRSAEAPLELVLAQGLSSGERMDFTIQKAVELGVTAVHPIATERSVMKLSGERATRKTRHWRKLAIAACEQCGRNRLVPVFEPIRFDVWLNQQIRAPAAEELRMLLSPEADAKLDGFPAVATRIILLAGPEGGLSASEDDAARRWNFQPVRLGPRILRTETAALAALAAIQLRWGDF
jgi:16S rRNA (uracil1498-N3)-methyltransferase